MKLKFVMILIVKKIWIHSDENIIKCKYKYPLKIKEYLLPLHKKKKYIFQQDNAPCHTSFKLLSFFSKHKIEVMYWPPNSPDLNPIENIWNLTKNQVRKNHYNNKEEMITEITKILSKISIDVINNLIDSMDNRIDALFNNNFDIIDY